MFKATAERILTACTNGDMDEVLVITRTQTGCSRQEGLDFAMMAYCHPHKPAIRIWLALLRGRQIRKLKERLKDHAASVRKERHALTEDKASCMLTGEDLNIEIIQELQRAIEETYPDLDSADDNQEYLVAVIDAAAQEIAKLRHTQSKMVPTDLAVGAYNVALAEKERSDQKADRLQDAATVQQDLIEEKDQEIERLKQAAVPREVYRGLLDNFRRMKAVVDERGEIMRQQVEEIRGLHTQVKTLQDSLEVCKHYA